MLDFYNAKFAMAKKDIWVKVEGGRVKGYFVGEIYPIIGDKHRVVKSDGYTYHVPIEGYERFKDEFAEDFILVESEDCYVEPYSKIRALKKEISILREKHDVELAPMRKRHSLEIKPLREELEKLQDIE